jgi:DNA-binding NtrC family response regulator
VEDDRVLNQLMCDYLNKAGFETTGVGRWSEAEQFLDLQEPRLIVADARLPDGETLERLADLVENQPVVILTAFGSVRNAVQAMKAGAADYLLKPVHPDELILVVRRTLDNAALVSEHQFCLRQLQAREQTTSYLIGRSAALEQVRQMLEAVAPTDMTVLIQGESGTGKELVARAVHDSSDRAEHSFMAIDCCTLQEKLFESELFGHERGAFTGADRQKKGLIEGAEGGTLFLDEIGEIDLAVQSKLLRVLETGTFRRVGGTRDLRAHVRVVAATNRDLEAMSKDGSFRADLYYRLSAFVITTPPLRDRREDIPYLVEHFINNHDFSRRIVKSVNAEAMRNLTAYAWPGNIRELKNVVERAIILSRDRKRIKPQHLSFSNCPGNSPAKINLSFDDDPTLEALEAKYLELQLQRFAGHRAKVAETLGISERSVYRLIKRYGLLKQAG